MNIKIPKKDRALRSLMLLPLSLLAFLVLAGFSSCADDLSDTSVFDGDSITHNDFDKWLYKNYVLPYNIRVLYKLPDMETNFQYEALSPAEINQSIQLAHVLKHAWIGAYEEVAGVDFIRRYAPKQLLFVGSLAFNSNGTATQGTAEGGMKVVLYGVNIVDMKADNNADMLNQYYFHPMHHEFAHILNQLKDYPTEFDRISEGDYEHGDWASFPGSVIKTGFISRYAMNEPREDFAETVSWYLTYSTEYWKYYVDEHRRLGEDEDYAEGIAKIYKKLAIAKKYYKESWGIDLDQLHDVVQRRIKEVENHQIDITGLE